MAQTLAERQRLYRQRKKENSKRLDLLIPTADMSLFAANAKQIGVTKAVYLSILLHYNDEADGKAQAKLELMTDLHKTTLKNHKEEVARLKKLGAPKHEGGEVSSLRETMQQREVAYNTLTGNLKTEIKRLKARPHECQCFKKDGIKCTKSATRELKKGNLLIHVCSLHYKTITS